MINKQLHTFLILILISVNVSGAGTRIRINQLGYLPNASKTAILISESDIKIQEFTLHDALTNETCATLKSVISWGSFDKFNSNYILDFSSFTQEGAFYIKVGDTYSPVIYINKNIYFHLTNQLITYLRTQRFGGDVSGAWWYDAANKNRNASVNAAVTHQLLLTYGMYPEVFGDETDSSGNKQPNGIPDVIDEAKWGLDWLTQLQYEQLDISVSAKLAAVFALGADVLSNFFPDFANKLAEKAVDVYAFAKTQDVIRGQGTVSVTNTSEENWQDDMQLAATRLYFLTYNNEYLRDAMNYGSAEPVPQWLFSTCDNTLQFYPYINWSPYLLMQVENPTIRKNYLHNMQVALQRAELNAAENPFNIGISLTENSNNKIAALHNLCHAYRKLTGEKAFIEMEDALFNWIFGCNPWGISMVTNTPENGNTPVHPHAKSYIESDKVLPGAMVSGAISDLCLRNSGAERQVYDGLYERYQTGWAVYRDHVNDFITNQPNIDGTAALLHLIAARQTTGENKTFFDKNSYDRGGINRFNPEKKQLAIIFTGHQYDDGYNKIRTALNRNNVKAAFFFSGDFLRKSSNGRKVKRLKEQGHYIGPATNNYTRLADWNNPESMGTRKRVFLNDLKENYTALKRLGISKQQAPFFNPPFELYNDSISRWCKDVGIYLVRSTPGTYSNLDYTFPEMRENYYSSKEIIDRIMQVERTQGLNGYILQFHFGVNPGRKDKFYNHLHNLIGNLKKAGYEFVDLYTATGLLTNPADVSLQKNKKGKK